MKKKIFTLGFAAVLVAGLMIAGAALAQPWDNRPGYGGGGGYWGCPYNQGGPGDSGLNLTADQQKKLTDLQEKYIDANEKISDQIVDKQRELRKLYVAEKPDFKAIDRVEDQVRDLMDKKFTLNREFRNSARALLTDEQLKAYPYAFSGPGSCLGYGPGPGYGRGGMGGGMGGFGPGRGRW